MNNIKSRYHGHRFPPEIISHTVWLYHRFSLSFRVVEDLLAERGIVVCYESIRSWCNKFGPAFHLETHGLWTKYISLQSEVNGDTFGAPRKVIMPTSMHCHDRYVNIRAEVSHEHTRAQERQMRRYKSPGQAQRFFSVHSQVHNLLRAGRLLLRAANYRMLRGRSFATWQQVTCAC